MKNDRGYSLRTGSVTERLRQTDGEFSQKIRLVVRLGRQELPSPQDCVDAGRVVPSLVKGCAKVRGVDGVERVSFFCL